MLPSSLELACLDENIELIQVLLGDFHYQKDILIEVTFLACKHNLCRVLSLVISLLEDKEIVLGALDRLDNNPIHVACRHASLKCVKILLEEGGDSPKRVSLREGSLEGSNIISGISPLHAACLGGNPKVVEYISNLEGVDLHAAALDGTTPLHLACVARNDEIVEYIVSREPTLLKKRTKEGYSPFDVCAIFGSSKALEKLLHYEKDKIDEKRLFQLLVLTLRSDAGLNDPHKQDQYRSETLNSILKASGNTAASRFLRWPFPPLPQGDESLKAVSEFALHVAARRGLPQCTQTLLAYGADVKLYNSEKLRPLELSLQNPSPHHTKTGQILAEEWDRLRKASEDKMNEILKEEVELIPKSKIVSHKRQKDKKGTTHVRSETPICKVKSELQLKSSKAKSGCGKVSKKTESRKGANGNFAKPDRNKTGSNSITTQTDEDVSSHFIQATQLESSTESSKEEAEAKPEATNLKSDSNKSSDETFETTLIGETNFSSIVNKGSYPYYMHKREISDSNELVVDKTGIELHFRERMDKLHPKATALELNVFHILGEDLEELSAAQLEGEAVTKYPLALKTNISVVGNPYIPFQSY